MQRPKGQPPYRPAADGYPKGWPQPAGAMTYRLNGTQVGRGNILNIAGSGITATPLDDGITYTITGGGGGGVTQLIGGTGISVDNGGVGVVTITNTGSSPITIENTNSLFSTGLNGLWNSTADLSIILGANAGDNADAVTSLIALGELSGASDDVVPYLPHYATMIGNRSGYNAHSAIDSTFRGHLAGAYAEFASYSFFAGAQAGISATYAGNSFMFGQAAGHNATNAAYSTFIGLESGYDSTNGGFSNFIGNLSGFQATNANNATFIGSQSGRGDTVNNAGTITYNAASGTFSPVAVITTVVGGRAYVISDDGAGTLRIMDSSGTFGIGTTITEFPSGVTANIVAYTPSTSSVLIGDHTTTGGGVNSVAIGAFASNAGYNNSIVIGVGGANDADNQYAWGDSIINWKFGGNNYQLPFYLPSGTGQYLGADPSGVLNWSVPGSSVNSLTVLAATTAVLPNTPSYANGAAGVGATLTAGSNGVLVVDGITIPLNGRVLVKDQVSQLENGVYQLSTVGTAGVPYVLTRTTDSDAVSDFDDMVVIPAQGTQSATPFGQQNVITAIGTDLIVFATLSSVYLRQETSGTQVAGQIPYYTSTGLTLSKGDAGFTRNQITNATTITQSVGNIVRGIDIDNFTSGHVFITNYDTIAGTGSILDFFSDTIQFNVSNGIRRVQFGGDVSGLSVDQGALDFNDTNLNINSRFDVRVDSAIMVFASQVTPTIISNRIRVDANGIILQNSGGGNTVKFEMVNLDTATTYVNFDPNNSTYIINDVGSLQIPVGSNAQRPTPVQGMVRFNTDSGKFEGYDGVGWVDLN